VVTAGLRVHRGHRRLDSSRSGGAATLSFGQNWLPQRWTAHVSRAAAVPTWWMPRCSP